VQFSKLGEAGSPMRLHVLVLNAGVMLRNRQVSPDGLEMTMAANHFGHFLLTNLLLGGPVGVSRGGYDDEDDVAVAQDDLRVVVLTSSTHALVADGLDLDNDVGACSTRPYTLFSQYARSKLANILFAKELAVRYPSVKTYCVHPGFVQTAVARNMHPVIVALYSLCRAPLKLLMKPASVGAWTTLHCACSPDTAVVHSTGEYWANCGARPPSPHATDMAAAAALWEKSIALTGLKANDPAA